VLSAPTADDDDSHLEASEKRQKLGSVQVHKDISREFLK